MAKRSKELAETRQVKRFSDLEREVMRRMLELEPKELICSHLGLTGLELDNVLSRPIFETELKWQRNHRDAKLPARLEDLAHEALDVVRQVMRSASSDAYRLRAALEILDRSGHVKIEKRLQVNADAEAIIKHLNQLGTKPAQVEFTEAEVLPNDPIEQAINEALSEPKASPQSDD